MQIVVFDCRMNDDERKRLIEVLDHYILNPPTGKEDYIFDLVRIRDYLLQCNDAFIGSGDYE